MGILGWIVLGLVIGALAKLIMPGKDPGGIIVTVLIGIVGSVAGGFIGKAIFGGGLGGFFDLRTSDPGTDWFADPARHLAAHRRAPDPSPRPELRPPP